MSSLTALEANGNLGFEMFIEPAGELELVTNPDSKMLVGESAPASSDAGSLDLQSLIDTSESLKETTGSVEVVVKPTTAGELELTTSSAPAAESSGLVSGDVSGSGGLLVASEAPSSTVPEPVTLLLTAVGLAGLSATKFRNRVSR